MRVVGVDIGGTKIAMGAFDGDRLLDSAVESTCDFEESMDLIARWSEQWRAEAIGVGCPGPLDTENGVVKNPDTLPGWYDAPLVERLKCALGVPVSLLNDADAALLGELWAGALCDQRDETALLLTFGTGVGGALWTGERIFLGANGEHPEIGHILVREGGNSCYCGLNGCLEAEASGTALDKMAQERGADSFKELTEKAELFEKAKQAIDLGLRVFAHTYRPATVVLGGGLIARYGEQLIPRSTLEAPMLLTPMRVVPAALGADAGLYGAAATALGVFL